MWEIWTKLLLPKGLKSCPKSNKSPNLVTLHATKTSLGLYENFWQSFFIETMSFNQITRTIEQRSPNQCDQILELKVAQFYRK